MSRGGAVALKAKDGTTVTIGNFAETGATRPLTTWGEAGEEMRYADPGVPLMQYQPWGGHDPLTVWKTQPSVRKVVGFIARHVAAVPWHGYIRASDSDRVRQAGSRMEKLMNEPTRRQRQTGYGLWSSWMIDRLLYDRACIMFWKGDGTPENPDRLVRIPPRMLEVKSNAMGEVRKIIFLNPTPGQEDVDLTDAPLVFAYGWSDGAAGGISPLVTLGALLRENTRALEWREDLWNNGPKISGILKHPAQFKDDTKRTRFLQDWRDWKRNQKGSPLLENGMEYEQLDTVTPKDARDIEGRTLTDIEVCSAYYVPPEMLGSRETTFGNIQAFRSMLYGPTLGPYFSELHQAVNGGIMEELDARPDAYVEQARAKAAEGSRLEQAKVYQSLVGGPIMVPNEARAELNLPALEGGDELMRPLNVTTGAQANPQDSGSQNEDPEADTESETP